MNPENMKMAVVGLGYVGLPLAVEFSKHYPVVGFDISESRISELKKGHDFTNEVSDEAMKSVVDSRLTFTSDEAMLADSNIFIITVPTPVDRNNNPDFSPLISASQLVGRHIKKGDYVIYESTVYPGATEEVCVPILENISGLNFNKDFFCGYSPERINPGDKEHRRKSTSDEKRGNGPRAAPPRRHRRLLAEEASTFLNMLICMYLPLSRSACA